MDTNLKIIKYVKISLNLWFVYKQAEEQIWYLVINQPTPTGSTKLSFLTV